MNPQVALFDDDDADSSCNGPLTQHRRVTLARLLEYDLLRAERHICPT